MTKDVASLFSVRSIYRRSSPTDATQRYSYEERVVLFAATSLDDAIAQAELEATDYCCDSDTKSMNYFMAYELVEDKVVSGSEVFSLIRDSDLDADDYIDLHFDTGRERAQSSD